MRLKPWVKMPARWVRSGHMAQSFTWSSPGSVKGSAAIAALQIWVVLATQAGEEGGEEEQPTLEAGLTYDSLMFAAGLSRKLVATGLAGLQEAGLLEVEKEGRSCRYHLQGFEKGNWCKLPARALYAPDKRVSAFQVFQKRSVCELHAMKLFLYYAAGRDNHTPYTMASFEKIHEHTGVPEKHIPRANAFLLNSRLLANIVRESSGKTKWKEPNKYFLSGYGDLFVGVPATT